MDTMTLPRSVRLALWLPHLGGRDAQIDRAVRAVQGDDEPHTVTTVDSLDALDPLDDDVPQPSEGLAALLAGWAPVTAVAAALPVPGDVGGVPAGVSVPAVDAGECVLVTTARGCLAAVPEVTEFGSVHEPGHLVTWHVTAVPAWTTPFVGTVGSLAEAEGELRGALLTATEALTSLDVARWRPDAAEAIASLRSTTSPGWPLPGEVDSRRVRMLVLAARLRAIVTLATADDGAAVNLWQADQRSAALRHVDRAARRAMCAATLVAPQA